MLSNIIESIKFFPAKFLDRISSEKIPEYLFNQPESVSTNLPYDEFIQLDRDYIILNDGLGFVWEMIPFAHEAMSKSDLLENLEKVRRAIMRIQEKDAIVQLIFDSEASREFDVPSYYKNPITVAQKIMSKRIDILKENADIQKNKESPTMRRAVYLTVKIPRKNKFGIDANRISNDVTKEVSEQIEEMEKLVNKLSVIVKDFEETFANMKSNSKLKPLDKDEFIMCVRNVLHSTSFKDEAYEIFNKKWNKKQNISEQISFEEIQRMPGFIEVGGKDTWEVLSWRGQPSEVMVGKMAYLLQINNPIRVVLNIRCNLTKENKNELEGKERRLRYAFSSRDTLQRDEVRDTLERIEKDEIIFGLSLHILYRNIGKSLLDMKKNDSYKTFCNDLERDLKITFIKEKWAGAAIFDLCLPLAYHPASPIFTGREELVLSNELDAYLLVLGGFKGHKGKVQIMQARSGDVCWISSKSSDTNSHTAVIGSSGSGKSFITANFLKSILANKPETNIFVIDIKTSYLMIAKTLSTNEGDFSIVKPPFNYPNIFLGDIDDLDRLEIIVSVIRNAIMLCDPTAILKIEHNLILTDAIKEAYAHNKNLAKEFYSEKGQNESKNLIYKVPKLDDVFENISKVCADQKLTQDIARFLMNKLSIFCSNGVFGNIFNQEAFSDSEGDIKQINLYDLEGAHEGSKIVKILATQICISDIIRMIKHPNNAGKPSVLLIDEAGVLLKDDVENKEIVDFVQTAWRTFRKLNSTCYAITNLVNDYKEIPACRTIWEISPHKLILRMNNKDIDNARQVKQGENNPLFTAETEYIVRSLEKVDGKYSQGYFHSEDLQSGTFNYFPTGYDYWLSVSKKAEIKTCELVKQKKGGYWEAIQALASYCPFGFYEYLDGEKTARVINSKELSEI